MSRKSNKVVKTISFNITNKQDLEQLKFFEGLNNFSGYVKGLIMRDLKEREQRKVIKKEGGGIKIVIGQ